MFVSLLRVMLIVSFCSYSGSFSTCGSILHAAVRSSHTRMIIEGARRGQFTRSKLPVRFGFTRPATGGEAEDADIAKSEDEGAGNGGRSDENKPTESALSTFQRLVSSFGGSARRLVPSAPSQDPLENAEHEAKEKPHLGAVLDEERLEELFGATPEVDEEVEDLGRENAFRTEVNFPRNRTGPIGLNLIRNPVTRLDPLTGAIVYNQTVSFEGVEEVQRLMEAAEEEEKARNRAEENAAALLGPAMTATAAFEKRNKGLEKPDQSFRTKEPYLGMVNGRGEATEMYVEKALRFDEYDEFGVPIRDPVELRNRRRNREQPAPDMPVLNEGGKLLDVPDVDPGELQNMKEFQEDVHWYAGGRPDHHTPESYAAKYAHNAPESEEFDPIEELSEESEDEMRPLHPREVRVQITSVVTNSSSNSTALDYVRKVYDFLKNETDNDPRIGYQIICVLQQGEAYPGMEDVIQMWLESYNVYHLIDGLAMKDAWGCIMPHIILGKKNLQAILDQVKWALLEDSLEGPLLPPKMRGIRLQGGKDTFERGYNTQESFSQHSVVNDT